MAASPQWKVYGSDGDYKAACKHVEDAAMIVAAYGDGATIRHGHKLVLWAEGKEDQPAGESYDHVYTVVTDRLDAILADHRAKVGG